MTSASRAVAFLAALAPVLVSCDPDDEPTGFTGFYTIEVLPAWTSIEQGGSTFVTVTLTRFGGFSDAVTLSVSGTPTGVTATMDPAVLSGSDVVSRIDFAGAAVLPSDTSIVTITATSGSRETSGTFQLAVNEPPSYALVLIPVALTIVAGETGTTNVTIERTNFTAPITFELVNPLSGIDVAFSNNPATSGGTGVTVTVAPDASPGAHGLTIRGTVPGLTDRTIVIAVTVMPAPSGAAVEYLYCDATQAPAYFAYQDGAGAWQPVAPTTSGGAVRFAFNPTSGRAGVLTVTQSPVDAFRLRRVTAGATLGRKSPGAALKERYSPARRSAGAAAAVVDVYQTDVWYATTSELASDGRRNCAATLPSKTISGIVGGVGAGQYGIVSLGGILGIYDGGISNNPLVFAGVPDGPVDLVASRVAVPGLPPDRGLVLRNLNVADGAFVPSTIDFNGPGVFVPTAATATVTGAGGDRLEIVTGLITEVSDLVFWSDFQPSQTTTRPWAGVNANLMRFGEFHSLIVFAAPEDVPDDFRVALRYVSTVSNQILALGPTVTLPTSTPASTGAYPRFRFQGALPADYQKGVGLSVMPEDLGNAYTLYASGAWLAATGSTSAYDLTMPDVAGLAGFPAAARLTAGDNVLMIDAFGFTGPGVFDVIPTLGSEFKASVRLAGLVVP